MRAHTFLALLALTTCCCGAGSRDMPAVLLKNAAAPGVMMPVVGLGTGAYGLRNGTFGEYWNISTTAHTVERWIRMGGRRLDTSLKYYHDISGVGFGIQRSGINRSELFITSKIDNPFGFNPTLTHFDTLLDRLNTSYVDLLLIHWPGPTYFDGHTNHTPSCNQHGPRCRRETWRALEHIFSQGRARAIGVSNFVQRHLEDIATEGALLPAVNQIELHPYLNETDLIAYCRARNITINGYAPLGAPDYMAYWKSRWPTPILEQPVVADIASRLGCSRAQVLILWSLKTGDVTNPRTWDPQHMVENLEVAGKFELTEDDMAALNALPAPQNPRVCPDPNTIP